MVQLVENVTVLYICIYEKQYLIRESAIGMLVDIHMQLIDKYQANEEWKNINVL